MTSELRPAETVWSIACGAYEDATAEVFYLPLHDRVIEGDKAAAAVIEADREAVRAEQAAELAKWKALAETLAGALEPFAVEWDKREFLAERHWSFYSGASKALTSYKEQRDA